MNFVSVFDGMACGYIAAQEACIKIDRYVAFEIDKYAVQTSSHNFPNIEHRGDVFEADFTEFRGFDFLVGGSPCTYWSIAQKNNRETVASGMGWELFSQYMRALHEVQPMYFIYENNKSMSKAIRASIDEAFGFEAVEINSALVSAQNRQRLYWVGKRGIDGVYRKVRVDQPSDRGILLKDVLDGIGAKDLTDREMDYMVRQTSGERNHFDFGLHQDATKGKGACVTANISKGVPYNVCCEPVVLTDREKARCVLSSAGRTTTREYFQKQQGTMAYEPVRIPEYGPEDKARPLNAHYPNNCGGFEHRIFCENPNKQQVDLIAQRVGTWPNNSKNQDHDSQQYRIYSTDGKGVTLCGNGGGMGAKTDLYAIPVEFDGEIPIKAVSCSDGKEYRVNMVKDGQITIKGKEYPIKLPDGYYIIRKLTVSECKRLQTIPEWYEFPVSDTQAYKMLGNGWTVQVIVHLINATQAGCEDEYQLNIFDMA